jgi:excisionase family DNA binding protein
MDEPETPLFVRLPPTIAARLDRASFELGLSKKELVTALLSRHMDFETPGGMNALRRVHKEFEEFRTAAGLPRKKMLVSIMDSGEEPETFNEPVPGPGHLFRGNAAFMTSEPQEVLTLEEAAELLQVSAGDIEALAAAGELPGRKIGESWRFSRAALLAWLRNDAE